MWCKEIGIMLHGEKENWEMDTSVTCISTWKAKKEYWVSRDI